MVTVNHQTNSPLLDTITELLLRLPSTPEKIKEQREIIRRAKNILETENPELAQEIQKCLATLRGKLVEIKKQGAQIPTVTLPEIPLHERATIPVPKIEYEPSEVPTKVIPAIRAKKWSEQERLLYQDVLTLISLGDNGGALTSLERLIMLNPYAEELATFLEKNKDSLRGLYREHLGSLDRIPVKTRGENPKTIPTEDRFLIEEVLRLVDGQRTIEMIVTRSKGGEIPTLATIAHLARSGYIEIT